MHYGKNAIPNVVKGQFEPWLRAANDMKSGRAKKSSESAPSDPGDRVFNSGKEKYHEEQPLRAEPGPSSDQGGILDHGSQKIDRP